jgi:hypothetical protein
MVNEKLDAIQAAVGDGEWTTVATEFKALVGTPMPADLKQQITAIGDKFKSLKIPGLDIQMPAIPGIPGPGETGGAAGGAAGSGGTTPPTTRPGGGS